MSDITDKFQLDKVGYEKNKEERDNFFTLLKTEYGAKFDNDLKIWYVSDKSKVEGANTAIAEFNFNIEEDRNSREKLYVNVFEFKDSEKLRKELKKLYIWFDKDHPDKRWYTFEQENLEQANKLIDKHNADLKKKEAKQ